MAQSSNTKKNWTVGFHDACSRLDISSIQSIDSFVGIIDAVSQDLAHSKDLRYPFVPFAKLDDLTFFYKGGSGKYIICVVRSP